MRFLDTHTKRIRYPSFFALFLIWTIVGTVSYMRYAIEAKPDTGSLVQSAVQLLDWLTCFYPWLFLSLLLRRIEDRFHFAGSGWRSGIPLLAVLSIPTCWIAYAGGILLDASLRFATGRRPIFNHSPWQMPFREIILEQAIFWSAVGACSVIRRLNEYRKSEELASRLAIEKSAIETSLRDSELELLRLRLHPHFLFNSLQNISTLTRTNPDAASRMLALLGELLRAALRKDARALTTIAAEIELTKAYIAVEDMRFDGSLSVSYSIDPGTTSALVPSFLLQPLVENAVTHGLKGARTNGTIRICSFRENDNLVLTVSDNGAGPSFESLDEIEMGIGLGSTCARLERLYPGRHAIEMRKLIEQGAEVRIVLPFECPQFNTDAEIHEATPIADRR